MAYLTVNKDGGENISNCKLDRAEDYWKLDPSSDIDRVPLPKGSIKKLIGKELTWNDEPVEI